MSSYYEDFLGDFAKERYNDQNKILTDAEFIAMLKKRKIPSNYKWQMKMWSKARKDYITSLKFGSPFKIINKHKVPQSQLNLF